MLTGFASAEGAKPGDLTFAENEYYFTRAEQGAAAAILVPAAEFTAANKVLIRVGNPRVAFARVLPLFFPQPAFQPGIHPTAVIHPSATIDPTASIGPLVYVGSQVRIGPRSSIQCGCVLGENVELGNDCQLFPRVTLYPQVRLGDRKSVV